METKKLKKGDVLWSHGESATTIAFVDSGRLGIKTEDGLVGLVGPPGVIGESALLPQGGGIPVRRAAVIAIEDSAVTEFPASFVREGVGAGVHRKILRSLIGQTTTSACFVLAAHFDVPLVTQSLMALIQSLANSKHLVREVRDWKAFAPDFAYLFSLRNAVDQMQTDLVPARHFVSRNADLLRATDLLKAVVQDPDLGALLDKFIEVEKERIEAVEAV